MNLNICKICGGELIANGDRWQCKYCGNIFTDDSVKKEAELLKNLLDEQKQEKIANLRRSLYDAIRAEYTDSVEICRLCAEIKVYLPDDFMANFFDIANRGTIKQVASAIRRVDTVANAAQIDLVFSHILASLCSEYVLPLQNMVERAYKNNDLAKFEAYSTLLSEEAACVDSGMYEVTLPRDVFVMYSSHDMDKVEELVEVLEENNLSCFVAARNLRHGRGAVENYQSALEQAMDNCRSVVFVSTPNSRNMSCDALKQELPYIKRQDILNAPAELRRNYAKIPARYKKARVEYLVEQSKLSNAADSYVKDFFDGFEYAYSPIEVADRVFRAINENFEPIAESVPAPAVIAENAVGVASLVKRVFIFLEDRDFSSADQYCEKVLDIDPENAEAYLGKLLAENKISKRSDLAKCEMAFDESNNYKKAYRYGDTALKSELNDYLSLAKANIEQHRIRKLYTEAINKINAAKTPEQCREAARLFDGIRAYKDSAEKAALCRERAMEILYQQAHSKFNSKDYQTAQKLFANLGSYRESAAMVEKCRTEQKKMACQKDEANCNQEVSSGSSAIDRTKLYEDELKTKKDFLLFTGVLCSLIVFCISIFLRTVSNDFIESSGDLGTLVSSALEIFTLDDICLSIYICSVCAILFNSMYYSKVNSEGFLLSLMFSLLVSGGIYIIIFILINNPLEIILNLFENLFLTIFSESTDVFQEGTGITTLAIVTALNYLIIIILKIILSCQKREIRKNLKIKNKL